MYKVIKPLRNYEMGSLIDPPEASLKFLLDEGIVELVEEKKLKKVK